MKKIFIFFILSFRLISQNGAPIFEFNHEFKAQVRPYKKLTNDIFREERKSLKIKTIRIKVPRQSLDSTYIENKDNFQYEIENYSTRHTMFSLIEIYNYDEYGFLTGHSQYPVCKYLTKTDSLRLNKFSYENIVKNDTTTLSIYYIDSLVEQTIHYKNKIIQSIEKDQHYITVFDSIKKCYISHNTNATFIKSKYEYFSNGKLKSISKIDKPYTDDIWQYEYPKTNQIFITSIRHDNLDDTTYVFQNLIIKDKSDRIVNSIFFAKIKPMHKSTYTMHYDKMGYLTSIARRRKYRGFIDENYTYYTFTNFYNKSKLIKTIVHYDFNVVENDIIVNFTNSGLIENIDHGQYKEIFEYEYYKN